MYLSDLFDDDNINFEPRQLKTQYKGAGSSDMQRKKNIGWLGSGVASVVFQKPNKPHEVKKISFTVRNIEKNVTYQYLKALVKHQDNPLLPRIYEVRVFKKPDPEQPPGYDRPDFYSIYVESEKLIEWNTLTWGEVSYLCRMYLGLSVEEIKQLHRDKGLSVQDFDKKDAMELLTRAFKEALNEYAELSNYNYAKDTFGITLKNKLAIDAVKKAASIKPNVPGMWNDLGMGNMMYRRTPTGIWPVLTDPFHQSR